MAKLEILEATIRDGAYEAGFQFQLRDVELMGRCLDEAGFNYIEVGHGAGLDANNRPWRAKKDRTPYTDQECLETARRAVRNAKLGIPYFPSKESDFRCMRLLREEGIDFVRLVFHARDLDNSLYEDAVQYAVEELGILVSVNFLKSYATPPIHVAEQSRKAAKLGVRWIYVVDSAGGMLPEEVAGYVEAIVEKVPSVRVGFHGHNNLQLAVANSLAAIDAGATLVDGSLQGMGRATGNAPTEVLLSLLQKRGHEVEINRKLVFAVGRSFVRRLVGAGFEPAHVISGASRIHSSSFSIIENTCHQRGLDIEDVLDDVGSEAEKQQAVDLIRIPADLVAKACSKISARTLAPQLLLTDLARILDSSWSAIDSTTKLMQELKAVALRDSLRAILAVVPEHQSPFRGNGLIRLANYGIAILAVEDGTAPVTLGDPDDWNVWLSHLVCDYSLRTRLEPAPEKRRVALVDAASLTQQAIAESLRGKRKVAARVSNPQFETLSAVRPGIERLPVPTDASMEWDAVVVSELERGDWGSTIESVQPEATLVCWGRSAISTNELTASRRKRLQFVIPNLAAQLIGILELHAEGLELSQADDDAGLLLLPDGRFGRSRKLGCSSRHFKHLPGAGDRDR